MIKFKNNWRETLKRVGPKAFRNMYIEEMNWQAWYMHTIHIGKLVYDPNTDTYTLFKKLF